MRKEYFINKSITLSKYNIIPLITIEILLSLLIYRIISPSLSIYILKDYFIIANLYIRYVFFNNIRLIIKLLRFIYLKTMLSIFIIKDLY